MDRSLRSLTSTSSMAISRFWIQVLGMNHIRLLPYYVLFSSNCGNYYFFGQISSVTSMWQTINLTKTVNALYTDNRTVWFNFSAWIGG